MAEKRKGGERMGEREKKIVRMYRRRGEIVIERC